MANLLATLRTTLAMRVTIIRFRARMLRYALGAFPIAGGAPDDPADGDDDKDKDTEPADGDTDDDDAADDGDGDGDKDEPAAAAASEPDWKRMARKHEREAKKARKEREDFAKKLKEREDADKSEQDKAVEEAEKRGRESVQGDFEKERRQDRLELATTKIASKGLKIGSGDKEKIVRFADTDDALLHLERDIRNGDLDPEDIFDSNGRVRVEQLEEALTDLLARKPHLAADRPGKVAGTADAGKGAPAKTETTVEDHFNKIRRNQEKAA